MEINNGTGVGYPAKVDNSNRLHTWATTSNSASAATNMGDAFNINTGLVSYSADGTMLYIKNNESSNLVIEAIAIAAFSGITHSDKPYITLIQNPTAGDLITDASAVAMEANRNFGSTKDLAVDSYKGKSAGTVTGGSDTALFLVNETGRNFFTVNFLIPKGNSLAIKLTANITNGSANYYAAAICHLQDSNI